ncbi:restriction endonuclease subunit S [Micromonospora sp. WMMD734]|uniref:restriction endonuclease subunit S n=1 Tax=Micromonospora sp. WMMD734 TaxID=3404129 RepID=UPI003B94009B
MTLNLDKSGWKHIAFGDVVKNLNITVRDAQAAGIERVIAMEHLDPNELKINRWGRSEDGSTFTRRVKPGQTLFGKRRAYQRKAAFAEFDAITSGDILVFEADDTQLLPEFLPFLVQSDGFYGHALGTSAGSLSPRTNWRDLASYRFDLPSLDEQKHLAGLLWAANSHKQAAKSAVKAMGVAIEQMVDALVSGSGAPRRPIGDILDVCQYGLSTRAGEDGAYPMLRMTNLCAGAVVDRGLKYCDISAAEFENHRVLKGDVLFNRTNSAEHVGRSGIFDLDGDFVFASYLVRLRPDPSVVDSRFLNYFINSRAGQNLIRVHISRGVQQANISASKLKMVRMPLPEMAEQASIVDRIDLLRTSQRESERLLLGAGRLCVALSREIFGVVE